MNELILCLLHTNSSISRPNWMLH